MKIEKEQIKNLKPGDIIEIKIPKADFGNRSNSKLFMFKKISFDKNLIYYKDLKDTKNRSTFTFNTSIKHLSKIITKEEHPEYFL